MTIEEVRDRVTDMVAEILALLPGMDLHTVLDMYWEELSLWHSKAIKIAKALRGVL